MITQEQLKELLDYNSTTGEFTWKVSRGNCYKPGQTAGCLSMHGYITIGINSRNYKAHRLAWLYTHGEWPKQHIDHIDGVKTNNAIANLRDTSHRENCQNRKSHRDGNLVGARWVEHNKKWLARIRLCNKQVYLGYFLTEEEAHNAYMQAALKLQETV
jgi:hypothetical protein